jgi:hypothetical protein
MWMCALHHAACVDTDVIMCMSCVLMNVWHFRYGKLYIGCWLTYDSRRLFILWRQHHDSYLILFILSTTYVWYSYNSRIGIRTALWELRVRVMVSFLTFRSFLSTLSNSWTSSGRKFRFLFTSTFSVSCNIHVGSLDCD